MAYIKKFDGQTSRTVNLGGEGQPTSIEGFYLGAKDIAGDYGTAKLHIFQTHNEFVGVWGKSRLNNLLTDDHKGQMCLVNFTGMIAPTKKGRRPSYGFSLEYDPSNTVDVGSINVNTSSEAAVESDNDDSDMGQPEDYESVSLDEVVAAKPVAPARPAQVTNKKAAQVNAMLKARQSKSA